MNKKKYTIVNDLFPESISNKINSKKKGQSNEDNLAKVLSEWVGTDFARVPRSGGIKWIGSQNLAGDLIVIDQKFKFTFCIETKHYKVISFEQRTNSKIFTWWKQVVEAAKLEGRIPLLFVKEDRMKDYVLFTDKLLKVGLDYHMYNGLLYKNKISLFGYHTDKLFRNFTYKKFKKNYKTLIL